MQCLHPEGHAVQVIIAGCGRVGAQLATELDAAGQRVIVIDKEPRAFRRLGEGFTGRTLQGIVFDHQTLEDAGARDAQAFVAVTSGDNSNIVAARTAKERFRVERVVARIYDPQRADIFERLGVQVIASARWTADAIMRSIAPGEERVEGNLGAATGDVLMVTMRVPSSCHGIETSALNLPGRSVLAALTRDGDTMLPQGRGLLEAGDLVHLSVDRDALDEVRSAVGLLGSEHR